MFLAALTVLFASLGGLWLINSSSVNVLADAARQTDSVTQHTIAIRAEMQKLVVNLLSADASMRDFLLTGHDQSLAAYRKATESERIALDRLKVLAKQSPEEFERAARVSVSSDRTFDSLEALRQYAPVAGSGAARTREIPLGDTERSAQELLAEIASMQAAQNQALAVSLAGISKSAQIAHRTATIFAGGLAAAADLFALGLLLGVVFRRERLLQSEALPEPAHVEFHPEPWPSPERSPAISPEDSFSDEVFDPEPPRRPLIAEPSVPLSSRIEPVPLRALIESAVAEIYERAAAKQISFRAMIGPTWDTPALADREALKRAIIRALGAIVDSGYQHGPVTISCSHKGSGTVRLHIKITSPLPADLGTPDLSRSLASMAGVLRTEPEAGSIWMELPLETKAEALR